MRTSDFNEPTFGKEKDVGTQVSPSLLVESILPALRDMQTKLNAGAEESRTVRDRARAFVAGLRRKPEIVVHVHVHLDTPRIAQDIAREMGKTVSRQTFHGSGNFVESTTWQG